MKISSTLRAVATLYAFVLAVMLGGMVINLIGLFIEPMLLRAMSAEMFQYYLVIKGFWLFIWQWSARFTVIILEYVIVAIGIEFAGNVLRRPV